MNHSRSSLETFISSCQVRHYLNYQFDNGPNEHKGLQPTTRSIDLEAGTLAHTIVYHVLSSYLLLSEEDKKSSEKQKEIFDSALEIGLKEYDSVSEILFDRKIELDNPELKIQSIEEHRALIHALTYLWFKSEFQYILENFQIITAEKEIVSNLTKSDVLNSRVDALLYNKAEEVYVTWSLKTTKMLGWFTNAMENSDLQGYLEMFAANNYLEDINQRQKEFIQKMYFFSDSDRKILHKFLAKRFPDGDRVSSVRFCFLVKGDRKGFKRDSPYPHRQNPLIYGWRKSNQPTMPKASKKGGYTEEEIELAQKVVEPFSYAHSFEFYNPSNDSGIGKLGKGWDRFKVWEEYPGGVEKWTDDIFSGVIQPEAKNPLENLIKAETIPRDDLMLKKTINYVNNVVTEINHKVNLYEGETLEGVEHFGSTFDFIPNTKSCQIPSPCDFQLICPFSGVGIEEWINDPKRENDNGERLFQIRVPHHPEKLENPFGKIKHEKYSKIDWNKNQVGEGEVYLTYVDPTIEGKVVIDSNGKEVKI